MKSLPFSKNVFCFLALQRSSQRSQGKNPENVERAEGLFKFHIINCGIFKAIFLLLILARRTHGPILFIPQFYAIYATYWILVFFLSLQSLERKWHKIWMPPIGNSSKLWFCQIPHLFQSNWMHKNFRHPKMTIKLYTYGMGLRYILVLYVSKRSKFHHIAIMKVES